MSKGTKRGGRTGRFGPRYGTDVRRRVQNIENAQFKSHRCPQCLTGELKRVSTSVWRCRKCEHKFAGGAYIPRTEAFGKAQAPAEEIEEVAGQLEAEEEASASPTQEPAGPDREEEPVEEPSPEEPEPADDEGAEAEGEAPEEEAPPETEEEPEGDDEDEGIETLFED